jgi:hypothetical protein
MLLSGSYDPLVTAACRALSHADRTPGEGVGWRMDPVTLIEVALTAGVAAGVKDTTSSAVKDAYDSLKAKVKGRLAGRPDAEQVLAAHEAAPLTWKESLTSELAAVGMDGELVTAAQELMRLIDAEGTQAGKYEVDVDGSHGVQIGDHNVQHNTFIASGGGVRGSGFGPAGAAARGSSDPIHPLGVAIHARIIRNEASGTIRADGPGSSVNIVADDITNAGSVVADQSGPGVRLADHLRVVAGHISDDVAEWNKQAMYDQGDSAFSVQYVRYGRGRQAGELHDSAVRAGLATSMARADFERATTPAAARRVANELVRWADELDRRRS